MRPTRSHSTNKDVYITCTSLDKNSLVSHDHLNKIKSFQLLRKVLHKFIIQYGAGWRVYLNLIGKGLDKGLIGEHFRHSR